MSDNNEVEKKAQEAAEAAEEAQKAAAEAEAKIKEAEDALSKDKAIETPDALLLTRIEGLEALVEATAISGPA